MSGPLHQFRCTVPWGRNTRQDRCQPDYRLKRPAPVRPRTRGVYRGLFSRREVVRRPERPKSVSKGKKSCESLERLRATVRPGKSPGRPPRIGKLRHLHRRSRPSNRSSIRMCRAGSLRGGCGQPSNSEPGDFEGLAPHRRPRYLLVSRTQVRSCSLRLCCGCWWCGCVVAVRTLTMTFCGSCRPGKHLQDLFPMLW